MFLQKRVIQNKPRYDQDETISGVTCRILLPGNAYGTRLASDHHPVGSKSEVDRSVHFHNFFATDDIPHYKQLWSIRVSR